MDIEATIYKLRDAVQELLDAVSTLNSAMKIIEVKIDDERADRERAIAALEHKKADY